MFERRRSVEADDAQVDHSRLPVDLDDSEVVLGIGRSHTIRVDVSLPTGPALPERATDEGFASPFAGYETSFIGNSWLSQVAAGLAGIALTYALCVLFGRSLSRRER